MLCRLVMVFLPRSKHLLISWLQSPSAVVLEPKKIKSVTVSTVSPSIFHEVMGPDAMIFVSWTLSLKLALSLSSFTRCRQTCALPTIFPRAGTVLENVLYIGNLMQMVNFPSCCLSCCPGQSLVLRTAFQKHWTEFNWAFWDLKEETIQHYDVVGDSTDNTKDRCWQNPQTWDLWVYLSPRGFWQLARPQLES